MGKVSKGVCELSEGQEREGGEWVCFKKEAGRLVLHAAQ